MNHEFPGSNEFLAGRLNFHFAITRGVDLWIEPTPANARRLMRAFRLFGIPLLDTTEADFATPGTPFNLGVPPCAIDFLTTIPGLEFEAAWLGKVSSMENNFPVYYLGKADLIPAKQAAGRPQDLADLDELRRA